MSEPEPVYKVSVIIPVDTGVSRLADLIRMVYKPVEIIALCADLLRIPHDQLKAYLARREGGDR